MKHLLLSQIMLFSLATSAHAAVSGAIFTTTSTGTVVNANHFTSKCAVNLDGGPGPHAPAKAAGMPDGEYFFQVTDPNGQTLLSTDPVSNRRFRITGGVVTAFTGVGGPAHPTGIDQDHASSGAITIQLANVSCPTDFLDTTNNGGVYKVWATPVANFLGNTALVDVGACGSGCYHGFQASQSKTDNFKVSGTAAVTFCLTLQKQYTPSATIPPTAFLDGWGITVTDSTNSVHNHYTTDTTGQITACQLTVGTYTVTEDTSGPSTQGGSCFFNSPYQSMLNGVLQPAPGTVTFTSNSTAPVNVTFVNLFDCNI